MCLQPLWFRSANNVCYYSSRKYHFSYLSLSLFQYSGLPVNSSHGQLVTRSTCHTVNSSQVNSSPGRLVTQSTRHRSTRHPVDSSRSRLVTKGRSTRHKQTSKPFCRSSIITLTRSPWSPPLRKNAQEIEQKTKWTTKQTHTLTQNFTQKGSPTNHSSSQKTDKCSFVWYINLYRSFYRFVTMHGCDGRTDRQTDRILIARPRLRCMQRGKNLTRLSKKSVLC